MWFHRLHVPVPMVKKWTHFEDELCVRVDVKDLSFIIGGGWVENGGSTKNLRDLRGGLRKRLWPERGVYEKYEYGEGVYKKCLTVGGGGSTKYSSKKGGGLGKNSNFQSPPPIIIERSLILLHKSFKLSLFGYTLPHKVPHMTVELLLWGSNRQVFLYHLHSYQVNHVQVTMSVHCFYQFTSALIVSSNNDWGVGALIIKCLLGDPTKKWTKSNVPDIGVLLKRLHNIILSPDQLIWTETQIWL